MEIGSVELAHRSHTSDQVPKSFFYLKPTRDMENVVCPPRRRMSFCACAPLGFMADSSVSYFSAIASGK